MTRALITALINAYPVAGTLQKDCCAFEALADNTVQGEPTSRADIPARVFGEGCDVVWLHGGGNVFVSPNSYAACAALLGHWAGMRVWRLGLYLACAIGQRHGFYPQR